MSTIFISCIDILNNVDIKKIFSCADFFQSALTFYFSLADKIFSFDILKKIFADGKNVDDIFYFVC